MDSIGSDAFSHCIILQNFTIPPKVTNIANNLFDECKSLSLIKTHDDVNSIERYAFARCSSLQNFTFPPKVTNISNYLFYVCNSLSSIIIKGNIASIDYTGFAYCSKLNFAFYNGTTAPSDISNVFSGSPADVVYVTPKYESERFCELPARLFPTFTFSHSEIFTKSIIFGETCFFTERKIIGESIFILKSNIF